MGIYFFDAYSPSHAMGGLTFYLLGFDFITSVILHTAFELFENYYWIYQGGYCIKIPFLTYRDCKTKADSVMNIISDTVFFIIGFLIGHFAVRKPYAASIHFALKLFIIGIIVTLGYSIITTNIIGRLPTYEHE